MNQSTLPYPILKISSHISQMVSFLQVGLFVLKFYMKFSYFSNMPHSLSLLLYSNENCNKKKVKSKAFLLHAMEVHGGRGSIALTHT
jgi:hypothetical protein